MHCHSTAADKSAVVEWLNFKIVYTPPVGENDVNYSYIDYPQTGIGQVFSCFIKKEYGVENYAVCGASTKSFIDKGYLREIEERITEGDFLFIQFGHNDEKIEDPARYTSPCGTFIDNLQVFIAAARKHGA